MKAHKKLTLALAGAVATLALASIGWAAIPDNGGVIHGCYKKDTGALRVYDTAASPMKSCTTKEAPLDWNQQGSVTDAYINYSTGLALVSGHVVAGHRPVEPFRSRRLVHVPREPGAQGPVQQLSVRHHRLPARRPRQPHRTTSTGRTAAARTRRTGSHRSALSVARTFGARRRHDLGSLRLAGPDAGRERRTSPRSASDRSTTRSCATVDRPEGPPTRAAPPVLV